MEELAGTDASNTVYVILQTLNRRLRKLVM